MDELHDFFDSAIKEQQTHEKWSRIIGPIFSMLIGLSISFIFSGLTYAKPMQYEFWANVCGPGCLGGFVTFIIMWLCRSHFLIRGVKLAQLAEEFIFLKRAGDKYGSFLFFVKGTKLDSVLNWFGQSRSLNMVIGKAIQKQLDSSFAHKSRIEIPINSYADFSNVTSSFLEVAKKVCFTCIYSPKNWFNDLESHDATLEELPKELQPQGYNGDKYPSHYVKFLQMPASGVTRRRAFLLDDEQWDSLIDTINIDYYKKFMAPCRLTSLKKETRFVKLTDLQNYAERLANTESKDIILDAFKNNITAKDYCIFEGEALLVYTVPRGQGEPHKLDFRIGDEIKFYTDFLNNIFKLSKAYGVYTDKELMDNFFNV